MIEISGQINPPDNFSSISLELSEQFSSEVKEIHSTTEKLIDLEEQLSEHLLDRKKMTRRGVESDDSDRVNKTDESKLPISNPI